MTEKRKTEEGPPYTCTKDFVVVVVGSRNSEASATKDVENKTLLLSGYTNLPTSTQKIVNFGDD